MKNGSNGPSALLQCRYISCECKSIEPHEKLIIYFGSSRNRNGRGHVISYTVLRCPAD